MKTKLIKITAVLLAYLIAATAAAQWSTGPSCRNGMCPRPLERTAPAQPEVSLAPNLRGSIVRIANADNSGRSLGSGTLIDKNAELGLVLTCAHLFSDGVGTITVTFPTGESFGAKLLAIDAQVDLAALLIVAPKAEPITVATEAPQAGEVVTSCGYGSEGQLACNRGSVLRYMRLNNSPVAETLEISGAARQGDSGGPMLNARDELVGVLFGTNGRVVDGTCCTRIRQFLAPHAGRFRSPSQPIAQHPQPAPQRPVTPPVETPVPQPPVATTPPIVSIPPAPTRPAETAPIATTPTPPTPPASTPIAAAAESWLSGKLVALAIGLGLPGWIAVPAVWLMMRRAHRRVQAKLEQRRTTKPASPPTPSAATRTEPTNNSAEPAIIVHTESPPLPQVVERSREFVQVRVPTQRLESLQWAMDEIVRRNPGMQGTVEMIEAYASQYQSGLKKKARQTSAVS